MFSKLTNIRNVAINPKRFYSKDLYETKNILQKGFVRLVDHMPSTSIKQPLYCDAAIPQMARISYGPGTKKVQDDKNLIRYLMRHHHTSPFEAVEFKFHLKVPLFVERQLIRHRTASVNQISGRYSVLPNEYYIPSSIRKQSKKNKQGSSDETFEDEELKTMFLKASSGVDAHSLYERLMNESDVSRELARIILPQSIFTELYWKVDLHNLLHFLYLRDSSHAQQEIRELAKEIGNVVEKLCPISHQAFLDYRVNAMQLSAQEIEIFKKKDIDAVKISKRERKEFERKLKRLNIHVNIDV